MYCVICGAHNPDDYQFCYQCGKPRPEIPPAQSIETLRGKATLTLELLVQISPLVDEVRQHALDLLPKMNESQKAELEEICWEGILNTLTLRQRFRFEEEMYNIGEGRELPIELAQIEDEILGDFIEKLDAAIENGEVDECRNWLGPKYHV